MFWCRLIEIKMAKTNDCSSRVSIETDSTTMTATTTINNVGDTTWRQAKRSLRRNIVKIHQLIDLTDKPIRMKKDEISCSQVRATGSNCICCCFDNSISLVTTNDSYIIDYIPLDSIQSAQANSSLQYLAMSNKHKIAIIDLVENHDSSREHSSLSSSSLSSSISCTISSSSSPSSPRSPLSSSSPPSPNNNNGSNNKLTRSSAKVVNLASKGLTMDDVLHWRWIDESCLALITQEALYICPVDQTQINHPALTALARSSQLLSIEKVCDINRNLASKFCRITDIQRDASSNLYAISALCRSSDFYQANYSPDISTSTTNSPTQLPAAAHYHYRLPSFNSSTLKHSFSSVPGRLSQLVHNERSFDSIKSANSSTASETLNKSIDQTHQLSIAPLETGDDEDELCGLVQIHCKVRDRSQLIQVHAVAFASCPTTLDSSVASSDNGQANGNGTSESSMMASEQLSTTLIAATRVEDKLRVHFIGMVTSEDLTTNGQYASPSTKFHRPDENKFDFPVSIVCSTINGDAKLHVAMIATKYGQLYVCSVVYGTILFDVRVSYDVISSTVVESKTSGLMCICRNGQVLLVEFDSDKLGQLLDESRCLRPIPSFDFLNSDYFTSDSNRNHRRITHDNSPQSQQDSIDLEVLISTKL